MLIYAQIYHIIAIKKKKKRKYLIGFPKLPPNVYA